MHKNKKTDNNNQNIQTSQKGEKRQAD